MDLIKYKKKKEELIKNLESIKNEFKDEEIKSFIDEKIETLEEDKFIVSIFGSFSNGKSSFLNALMGFKDEILVIDEKASTAAITKIRYPKSENLLNKGEIVYKNGQKKIVELEDIKKYCARNNDVCVEETIQEVILYLDSEILKNGVEIVDTPGFNSVHSIHTDIAKNYIENSNASIFLFDYSKPGGQTEFKFLGEINDKMDKIFLVLNKVDLENKTETTLENTIKILRKNIEIEGANIRNKEVHPISAKLELEALHNKKNDEYFKSFRTTLESYLLSEENIKDRLESPIKKIIYKLNDYRKIEKNMVDEIVLEESDLKKKIFDKEEKIEEKVNELKGCKRIIKKATDEAIKDAVKSIERSKGEIIEELKEELDRYKTRFSLRLCDFNEMVKEIEKKTRIKIEENVESLSEKIQEIVEENIDDTDEISEDLKKDIFRNIKLNVKFREEEYEKENEDILDISDIEEKIENLKEEVIEAKENYVNASSDKKINDEKLNKIERLKKHIEELKRERNIRIRGVGKGNIYTTKVSKREKINDGTVRGFFQDKILGGELVEINHINYDEVTFCEEQRSNIEKKYEKKIDEIEDKLINSREEIKSETLLDIEVEENRETYEEMKIQLRDSKKEMREEKVRREDAYIEVRKRDYIKQVKKAIEDVATINKKEIKDNEKLIKSIALDSLSKLEEKIEKEKDIVMTLRGVTGKGREELNLIINEKYTIIGKIDKYIDMLREAK